MPMRTMTLCSLKTAALYALLAVPVMLHAQGEVSASEEQRLEALAREQAENYLPRNSVTVGFRLLGSGAKVKFGHLGEVDFGRQVAPISDGAVQRTYDNGQVNLDAPRTEELDANGVQTSPPGGRYQPTITVTSNVTDADGNITGTIDTVVNTGDYLSYTPGLTRSWSYGLPEQAAVRPGYIALSSYSASSDGGAFETKRGPSGGVELQFARIVSKVTNRTQWSINTGISLNDINRKTRGDVSATLNTQTDFYSLNGLTAPDTSIDKTYTAPTYTDVIDANGSLLILNGFETTTPLSAVPSDHTESVLAGGTTVHGKYQIKGAYFLVRLGPSVRTQLTERLGLSASLGLAGAYSGTTYSVVESFEIPGIGNSVSTADPELSSSHKFLGGFYADLNLEWAANESTGLFGGITAQKFGDYDQTVGGRTARIDLGSSVGVRGGISIKF